MRLTLLGRFASWLLAIALLSVPTLAEAKASRKPAARVAKAKKAKKVAKKALRQARRTSVTRVHTHGKAQPLRTAQTIEAERRRDQETVELLSLVERAVDAKAARQPQAAK